MRYSRAHGALPRERNAHTRAAHRPRARLAGGALHHARAVVVKPYGAIFLPWLATRRDRTALATMTAAVIMLLLVPAIRYGWHGNLHLLGDWWRTVTTTTAPNLANPDNASLGAMYAK